MFLTSRVSLLASLAGFPKGSAYMCNSGTSDLFSDLSGNEVGASLLRRKPARLSVRLTLLVKIAQ